MKSLKELQYPSLVLGSDDDRKYMVAYLAFVEHREKEVQ